MVDKKHIRILKKGVPYWNKWREENPDIIPDLSGANLIALLLMKGNFINADLSRANLSMANLCGAKLNNANLREACFHDASLEHANLSSADLSFAILVRAYLLKTNFYGANLTGARMAGAHLIETNLTNTVLDRCWVYGISVWDTDLTGAKQQDIIITPDDSESTITVDNLEIAQFIYLILFNKKIRGIIDEITSKVVLILGRFTPKRKKILDALREELRSHNLVPIIFDFKEPNNRDLIETAMTLAYLARFVIVDLTEANTVIQELPGIVEKIQSVPVQPIQSKNARKTWAGYQNIKRRKTVLEVYRYADEIDLQKNLKQKIIIPAESLRKQLLMEKHETEMKQYPIRD